MVSRRLRLLAACGMPAGFAEEPVFSLTVAPAVGIPLGADATYFTVGAGADISAVFSLPFLPVLKAGFEAGYKLAPLGVAQTTLGSSLSFLAGGAVLGLELEVLPKLRVGVHGGGGYYYSFFTDQPASSGANPYVGGGAGVSYRLAPSLGLGFGVSYRAYLGLYSDLQIALDVSLHVARRARPAAQALATPTPEPLKEETRGIEIVSIRFDNIFPVFFKYYDNHPIGKATIRNTGTTAAERVRLTFNVKQYMDNPTPAPLIERLDPGEQTEVKIFGLFTSSVLDITEGTLVSAVLEVSYLRDGKEQNQDFVQTIRLQDRNAVTWDDDRKAAADGSSESPVSDEPSVVPTFTGEELVKLVSPDAQVGGRLGYSVCISGDCLIVAAYQRDGASGSPVDAGIAFILHRTGTDMWGAGEVLVAPGAQANDLFGCSASISGDYAVVGAYGEDGGEGSPLPNAGAAYLY